MLRIAAMSKQLPVPPDFAALDAAAAANADERTRVLALIGNLVVAWSNNESMFIYLLMLLLRTDIRSATIVFITLNTTRARLDLIRRLAKTQITDARLVRRIDRMIEKFGECTRVRNDFNHCIYQVDEAGRITHTSVLRMHESKSSVLFEEARQLDAKRVREVSKTIRSLTTLNRELWAFLPELEAAMRAPAGKPPTAVGRH